jgi:hypothetical protein
MVYNTMMDMYMPIGNGTMNTHDLSEYSRQNLLVVKMFLQSTLVVVTAESKALTLYTFLGSVGGTGGLCLGLSFITVCEFAEFFTTALWAILGQYISS